MLCYFTNKFKPVAPSPQPYTQTQAYTQNVWFRGNYSGPSTPERKQPPLEETNKLYSNMTYVDSVSSTFVNKGFITESTNRMQEHWDVKLRVRLLLTLKVMSITKEAKNSI